MKRKHLPVLKAGERYEGWMPFVNDEPLFVETDWTDSTPLADVYATRKDALTIAEDVRHVTIIVTRGKVHEWPHDCSEPSADVPTAEPSVPPADRQQKCATCGIEKRWVDYYNACQKGASGTQWQMSRSNGRCDGLLSRNSRR